MKGNACWTTSRGALVGASREFGCVFVVKVFDQPNPEDTGNANGKIALKV
jgi:hypothetical protein